MHWSDEIANKLISMHPDKDEFVLAAGTSPSGTVHIGNFRDAVTVYFVAKALRKKGKKTVLLLSWDDMTVSEKYLKTCHRKKSKSMKNTSACLILQCPTLSVVMLPMQNITKKNMRNPLKNRSQIRYNQISNQGIHERKYKDGIITALKNRKEIYDIMQEFKTQEYSAEERENFYPLSVYCDKCGKTPQKSPTCRKTAML